MEGETLGKAKSAGTHWLARMVPDCRALTLLLGESLDRGTTLREKITALLHLAICQACRQYLKQIKFIRRAFRTQEQRLRDGAEHYPSHRCCGSASGQK